MQSWLEGRIWVGKGAQATGMTASLRIQSSKADSNTWESFTRSGLKLESVHQESPRSDVFRKRATKPLLKQKHCQKHLTWAVEKKNWTVAQWSKVLFSDESTFCISFGNKVPESGGRVESHRIHVAWSPVWSFHSQWWFGLLCHLLVLVHCVFWSPQSTQPSTRTFKALHASFCWQALWRCWFHFPAGLGTCPHCQRYQKLVQWPWCYCAWLASKLAWPEPIDNLWGIVKRKMRDTRPNNADDLKATVKETWASIPPQQCHKLITSMPRWIEAVIKAKGAPTKYWVHIQ